MRCKNREKVWIKHVVDLRVNVVIARHMASRDKWVMFSVYNDVSSSEKWYMACSL